MAHSDLDQLLNVVLPPAQDLLKKHGEFYPFAVTLGAAGDIAFVATHDGNEFPRSDDVIDAIWASLRQAKRERAIAAIAVCYDGRVIPPDATNKTDAICCLLEHQTGESCQVFLPYSKRTFGGFRYGDIFAVATPPHVFLPDDSADC